MKTIKHLDPKVYKQSALQHFQSVDKKLYTLAKQHLPTITLPTPAPIDKRPAVLMKSIVGQQISIKAANSIWQRLQAVLFTVNQQLNEPNIEELIANGASAAKAKSLIALSQALRSKQLDMSVFDNWENEQIVDHLIQYPGIGPWTAEMFLISGLGRLDVFSLRDLGLRTALSRLHGLPPEIEDLKPLVCTYSPYGTLAALICWRSLDNGDLYAEV